MIASAYKSSRKYILIVSPRDGFCLSSSGATFNDVSKARVQKVSDIFIFLYTQRNGPLSARGKSFCENSFDAKRISFGIQCIPLEPKN